jgi:hypothetical protein
LFDEYRLGIRELGTVFFSENTACAVDGLCF